MQPNTNSAPAKPWLSYFALLGLVLLFVGLGVDVFHQISRGRYAAETTYYTAASALAHGRDPYGLTSLTYPYVYPPLYACCFRPLANLSEQTSARAMAVIDGCFILAALLLSTRAMLRHFQLPSRLTDMAPLALIAALIAVVPIHNEWRGLETNSLVLLSFALAFYWLDRRPILAGLALAAAINIKYLPIIALPYFLLRRRWIAAVATVAWTIVLAILPAIYLGWSTNLYYLREAVSGLSHLASADAAGGAQINSTGDLSSLSVTSAITRAAQACGWSKHAELALVALVVATWIGMILLIYRREKRPIFAWPGRGKQQIAPFQSMMAVEWAAMVTFALAFSPNTQNRNLVLAIIPATLAAVLLCTSAAEGRRVLAATACVVMLIGLSLPFAAMGKPFTVGWLTAGGPCWTLLATMAILAFAGVGRKAERGIS